jgi:hypothetical protein
VRIVIRFMNLAYGQLIRLLLTGLLTGLTCMFSKGQSVNELRKLWQDNTLGYFSDNQKDKLFSAADFHKYSRIRDDDFGEYLKEPWHDYAIMDPLSDEPRIHLFKKPVFNFSGLDMTPPVNLPFSGVAGFNNSGTGQIKLIPRIRKPESDEFTSVKGVFLFYGQPVSISYDKLMVMTKIMSVSEDTISGFWNSFARSNSNHLVDQLMDYRDLLGLGDWGYFQLVKAASGHICKNDRLAADLMTWALMIRSGFDVRLAFNQNTTTVLFPSENMIYFRKFIIIGQRRFYLDREMNSQLLVTYKNPFPDTDGSIDLLFNKSLNFKGKLTIRKFLYPWNNTNYEFTLRFNPEVTRFYSDYPQTDPSVYFGAPLTSTLKEDLLEQLYPLLSKMDKAEAVAFLQQFVQREFNYTTENQENDVVRGRFAEESVASKSGDDRSKSVLFSWLVRDLIHLPVVGVHFPGYYSVAVCFDKPLEGDYYFWNRKKYSLTDPTFLNAPIGVMMPELSALTAQLVDIQNADSQSDKAQDIWNQASKSGAVRGGRGQDIVFDRQGRALITGYFNNRRSYTPFIACFSQGNSLQWIRKFEGDGKAVAFAITKVNEDEIYIAGSFQGKLVLDGASVQSFNKPDLFIAQVNQNGDLVWMNKAGIDYSTRDESLSYMVKFDRPGDNISVQWSNEDERNIKTGFGEVSETGLRFTGSGISTPGLVPYSWTDPKTDVSGSILNECNVLIRNKCQPKVAGVMALMKMLQKPGAEITGSQLQTLLTRHNPTFQVNHPSAFSAIGQVEQLKNENGIIALRIIGNKSIVLNNLRIDDGARFSLSFFGNGDLSVSVVSGLRKVVKKVELPLNSLLIDFSSGNFVLDFDSDHTMKTIPSEKFVSPN